LFETVILGCRDSIRGQQAVESIRQHDALPPGVRPHFEPLTIGDHGSHVAFRKQMEDRFGGSVDVLVNNAAIAFKGSDPTPFEGQTKPTLDINFRGTVDFTEQMLPLLRKAASSNGSARIVNMASMAGRLSQVSDGLQQEFSSSSLTMDRLRQLMDTFEEDVQQGQHRARGWSNSNYGMSKLAVIAATKIWAREEAIHNISVNCCCPGYCSTDMSSHRGTRSASDGARNAVLPATMENPPTGELFENLAVSQW
jgi:carbonyl reductase 1